MNDSRKSNVNIVTATQKKSEISAQVQFDQYVELGLKNFDSEDLLGKYDTVIIDSKPEPVPPVVMEIKAR